MNCFEHIQKPAVGTCTYCGRGLCKDCVTVVDGRLSCRGDCQQEVIRFRQLMEISERAEDERVVVYGTSAKVYQQAFASTAFFGLLFVIVGAILLSTRIAVAGAMLIALGIAMGIRGAGFAGAGRKYKSLAENRGEGSNL